MSQFTLCALCYGDYPELAERCLGSFRYAPWHLVQDVRIGLNAVSKETNQRVCEIIRDFPVPAYLFITDVNAYKYPLMREMFFSPYTLGLPQRVMWFDDDSCLQADAAETLFPELVERSYDMAGRRYVLRKQRSLTDEQWRWVQSQAWCNPKLKPPVHLSFFTGGWWTIQSKILRDWNWPTPDLLHNGGDYMLGELCRHQGYLMREVKNGYWVNADASGKPSTSKRRGLSTPHVGTSAAATAVRPKYDLELLLHQHGRWCHPENNFV